MPVQDVRILIVEDKPDVAGTLAQILGDNGCTIRICHDGEQALADAQDWLPDMVFLDIGLPKLDGWAVARHLRQRAGGHAMIVALTACSATEDYLRSDHAGIDLHLVKPVDPALLIDLVNRFRAVAYP